MNYYPQGLAAMFAPYGMSQQMPQANTGGGYAPMPAPQMSGGFPPMAQTGGGLPPQQVPIQYGPRGNPRGRFMANHPAIAQQMMGEMPQPMRYGLWGMMR